MNGTEPADREVGPAPDHLPHRPTARWLGWVAIGVGLALVVVRVLSPDGPVGDWTYLAVAGGAGGAAWLGARRSAARSTAMLVALGVLLSAAGDLLWQLQV